MENEGASPLARVAPTGGDVETFLQPDHTIESFTIAHDGKLATLESTSLTPGEIFFDGSQRTFTNKPLLDELSLGPTEEIQFPSCRRNSRLRPSSSNHLTSSPADATRHYSASTAARSRNTMPAFHYEAQLFAANGYVVVMPNPRGSSGYGQDFARAIWQGWGDKDYEDVLAAVDHTIELGYTDRRPNRRFRLVVRRPAHQSHHHEDGSFPGRDHGSELDALRRQLRSRPIPAVVGG